MEMTPESIIGIIGAIGAIVSGILATYLKISENKLKEDVSSKDTEIKLLRDQLAQQKIDCDQEIQRVIDILRKMHEEPRNESNKPQE